MATSRCRAKPLCVVTMKPHVHDWFPQSRVSRGPTVLAVGSRLLGGLTPPARRRLLLRRRGRLLALAAAGRRRRRRLLLFGDGQRLAVRRGELLRLLGRLLVEHLLRDLFDEIGIVAQELLR